MQTKRYEVLSINEGMARIKDDLGPNAIILSSKRLKGKKRSFVEMIAARDDYCGSIPNLSSKKDKKSESAILNSDEAFLPFRTEIDQLKALIMDTRKKADIHSELTELRETLNTLFDILGVQKNENISSHLSKFYYHLISIGISRQRAFQLIEELKNNYSQEILEDYRNLLEVAEGIIKRSIAAFYKNVSKKRVISFVGPAGSGKTTTLAKLAAQYLFSDRLDIGILTTDTYRIGATEQLKIYADIMGLPLQLISKKEEFKESLDAFGEKDIILIDTPGKTYKDENYLMKLKELFAIDSPIETNLILNITANQENMIETAERFGIINYDNIIFTKLDEANNFGSIYNIIDYAGKPVFYITNGQNVPQDLEKVDPGKLARLIVKNTMVNIDSQS
ncbi:MAG: flagellar biosynthesis protein FlhF [Thermodesulfobacteriota bacterium]|nr:flagellar biosynthesis protein FlhF [Deltaproteobacteria bacterium]RKX57852.1 MAG: flagellar biosynthesis protein FlhF [Thermodesulfobacteriota bacterium]